MVSLTQRGVLPSLQLSQTQRFVYLPWKYRHQPIQILSNYLPFNCANGKTNWFTTIGPLPCFSIVIHTFFIATGRCFSSSQSPLFLLYVLRSQCCLLSSQAQRKMIVCVWAFLSLIYSWQTEGVAHDVLNESLFCGEIKQIISPINTAWPLRWQRKCTSSAG